MIYFDNAATTQWKPPAVAQAVAAALTSFGGVGRGVHEASLAAGMAVFDARDKVARLLGAPSASRVSFAQNATAALNIAIRGLLPPGGAALTTAASHNSVLRPLFRARDEQGCEVRVAPVRPDGSLDLEAYGRLLVGSGEGKAGGAAAGEGEAAGAAPVRLVVATHASNLTGDIYDVAAMAELAHKAGAVFVLDAAQTAGAVPVDMAALGADVLCFTGHKSLLGPQGTGGLCVAEGIDIPPLLEGGSGTHSFDERHPRFMPEALEAGTLNAHGLAGLAAGVGYLQEQGVADLAAQVRSLTDRFEEGVCAVPGVQAYGGHGGIGRCGIVALNVGGLDSAYVADRLASDFGIATRAGAHCAPLMHRALGTEQQGAVRFSFSHANTQAEVDAGIEALRAIAQEAAQ